MLIRRIDREKKNRKPWRKQHVLHFYTLCDTQNKYAVVEKRTYEKEQKRMNCFFFMSSDLELFFFADISFR